MRATMLLAAGLLLAGAPMAVAEVRPPQVVFAKADTNLSEIAPDKMMSQPLKLYVLFSLKAAPGSPEAKAFLKENLRVVRAQPQVTSAQMTRLVTPAKQDYLIAIQYPNWKAYQEYDTNKAFLAYYHDVWKPGTTGETAEILTLLDSEDAD